MKKIAAFSTVIIVALQISAGIIVAINMDTTEDEQMRATDLVMLMDATAWFFAFTVIALLTTGLYRQLMIVVILLSLGKLIDEVYFSAYEISWNDILNFAIGENIAIVLITAHLVKNNYAKQPR